MTRTLFYKDKEETELGEDGMKVAETKGDNARFKYRVSLFDKLIKDGLKKINKVATEN